MKAAYKDGILDNDSRVDKSLRWFVAIDETQIGPISIQEVRNRFDNGELSVESMVWTVGLEDWLTLGEVPALQHWVTEVQQEEGIRHTVSPRIEVKNILSSSIGDVGNEVPRPRSISWKPTVASELSELVEEELSEGWDSTSGDSINGGSFHVESFEREPSVHIPKFEVPTKKPRNQFSSIIKMVLFVGGVGSGIWILQDVFLGRRGEVANKPKVVDTQNTQGANGGSDIAEHAKIAPSIGRTAPTDPESAVVDAIGPRSKIVLSNKPSKPEIVPKRKKNISERPRKKIIPRARAPERKKAEKAKSGGLDDVFEDSKSKDVVETLERKDIVLGVRENADKVRGCLKTAKKQGEITSGSHKLTLDWDIRPDGSVVRPKLKGPAQFLGTSLADCFETVMRSWDFPRSSKGRPIRNYPFGPINIR